MQNSISLVNTTILNRKNSEVQNKITDFKYITPEEVNKLMAKFSRQRLRQGDLVNKTDFDNKLTSFNK